MAAGGGAVAAGGALTVVVAALLPGLTQMRMTLVTAPVVMPKPDRPRAWSSATRAASLVATPAGAAAGSATFSLTSFTFTLSALFPAGEPASSRRIIMGVLFP